MASKSETEQIFLNNENDLIKSLGETQNLRKSEETTRSQLRSENKTLEDMRHSLETQKGKVDRNFKKLRDTMNRKYQQMEQWKSEMEEADKNLQRSENVISDLNKKYDADTSVLKKNISSLKKEVTTIEKEVKKLNSDHKKSQSMKSTSLDSIDEVKKKVDGLTGTIDEDTVKKILAHSNVHKSVKDAIKKETEIEGEIESKWREDQKELENRYVAALSQYETSNSAYQRAHDTYKKYNPLIQISSTNSPNSDLAQGFSVPIVSPASLNQSEQINISSIPSLKSTSGSSKNKRKSRSRRNTKSNSGSGNGGLNGNNNINGMNTGRNGDNVAFINTTSGNASQIAPNSPSSTLGNLNISGPISQVSSSNHNHILAHHSSFPFLNTPPSAANSGFSMPTNNGGSGSNLFPTHSSNATMSSALQMAFPGVMAQPNNSSPDFSLTSSQSAMPPFQPQNISVTSIPNASTLSSSETTGTGSSLHNLTGISSHRLPLPLDTRFTGSNNGDLGDLQSPSDFVPSYIIKDDDQTHSESQSSTKAMVSISPSSFGSNAVQNSSLVAMSSTQTNPSLTSYVSRPSAGMLARAMHHRTNSSDSILSPRVSIGSTGIGGGVVTDNNDLQQSFSNIPSQDQTSIYMLNRRASFNHIFGQQNSPLNQSVSSSSPSSTPSLKDSSPPIVRGSLYVGSPNEHETMNQHFEHESNQKSSEKNGSMFSSFFGSFRPKQSRKSPTSNDLDSDGNDPSSAFNNTSVIRSDDQTSQIRNTPGPIGPPTIINQRTRSGSLNSVNSLPLSLGEPFGSSAFSPWNNTTTSVDMINAQSRHNKNTAGRSNSNTMSSNLVGPALTASNLSSSGLTGIHMGLGEESGQSSETWGSFIPTDHVATFSQAVGTPTVITATSQGSTSLGDSISATERSKTIWKDTLKGSDSHVFGKRTDNNEPNDSVIQSPSPNPNKSRFSRGFSGLFNISKDSNSGNVNSHSLTDDESHGYLSQPIESNSISSASPNGSDSHDGNSLINNRGKPLLPKESDGSLNTNSSSGSSLQPPAPYLLSSPQSTPSQQHKSGLLQKGIRTFSLPRKSISSSGTSGLLKEKDIDKEKGKDREKEASMSEAELIHVGTSSQSVSTGSKLAKRLSIFGGSKKEKEINDDDRPSSKESKESKDRDRSLKSSEDLSESSSLEGQGRISFEVEKSTSKVTGKKDGADSHDYHELLDRMRK